VGNDKKIVLLSFKLQNARLKTNREVMVGLWDISQVNIIGDWEPVLRLEDIGGGMGPARAT